MSEETKRIFGMPQGCVVAASVVIVLALLAVTSVGMLIYVYSDKIIAAFEDMPMNAIDSSFHSWAREQFIEDYDQCARSGAIPEEQRELFGKIYELATSEGASADQVVRASSVTVGALEDGVVTPEEEEEARDTLIYLEWRPERETSLSSGQNAFLSSVGLARMWLAKQYPEYKERGVVPEEQRALFDEIYAFGTAKKASPYAVLCCFEGTIGVLHDGVVTADEITRCETTLSLLKANPETTDEEWMAFMSEDPQMRKMFSQ